MKVVWIDKMWLSTTRGYTTEETEAAEWAKNGDEVYIYTWCNATHRYVKEKFN
jgi:hypothetical protein